MPSGGIQTSKTLMGFSANLPATYTSAGYAALTYTASCEVIDIGEFGIDSNTVTYETICDGVINKRKGAIDYGTLNMVLAHVPADAADILLIAQARNTTGNISVRFTLNTGRIMYVSGVVKSYKFQLGGNGEIIRAAVVIELNTDHVVGT
jgi:hypothetical protein